MALERASRFIEGVNSVQIKKSKRREEKIKIHAPFLTGYSTSIHTTNHSEDSPKSAAEVLIDLANKPSFDFSTTLPRILGTCRPEPTQPCRCPALPPVCGTRLTTRNTRHARPKNTVIVDHCSCNCHSHILLNDRTMNFPKSQRRICKKRNRAIRISDFFGVFSSRLSCRL